MSDSPIKATLKAGPGYDVPWLTIDADNPSDLEQKLRGIIDSKVLETVAEAASMFQATQNAAPLTQPQGEQPAWPQGPLAQGSSFGGGDRGLNPPAQQAAPQQPQGWGAAQQQAPQQQQQYGGGGSKFAGPPHPEGKQCEMCGKVLEFKKTSTGKGTWRCPDWRWGNGTPNGHTSEWAN